MELNDSPILRCPYCWGELPKQIKHVAAFPHPLLRSQDKLYQRIHNIIRPRSSIERESSCNNCGKKFSITFFTKIPDDIESKKIYNICNEIKENKELKPWFENFLQRFFNKFKNAINWIFGYKIYESSQAIFNYIAAFVLICLPFTFYLFIKTRPIFLAQLSRFDFFLFCCVFVAAFLVTQLMELIEWNNAKLNLSTLHYGLHENYINSKWGKAFEECYLQAPTNEYISIVKNLKISRPMLVGLLAPLVYLVYKSAFIIGNYHNPNYPMLISISIIPFYLMLFFIMGYSLSYSIIGSPVVRVIAREINLKIDLFKKTDSYQELGELLEKSMMVFISILIIFSIITYGMYDSKIMTFNFKDIVEFMIFVTFIFLVFGFFSWIWVSSLIDLKDKYQNVKDQCLIYYKKQLDQIEFKEEKCADDIVRLHTLLFKINRILTKPIWPLERPILLSLLPFLSTGITIVAIMRQMGGFN
jgi:hypothetical protein